MCLNSIYQSVSENVNNAKKQESLGQSLKSLVIQWNFLNHSFENAIYELTRASK